MPPTTLFICSDGGFPPVPDFALERLTPVFLPVGHATTENRAVTALAVDRDAARPDRWLAFARVANFGDHPATVQLELSCQQQPLDVVELVVAAGEESSWQFELPELDEGVVQVHLDPPDALASDNVAYAVINRPRPARVLVVSPGSDVLRAALATDQVRRLADVTWLLPSALERMLQQEEAAPRGYDLVIFDRWQPPRLPTANTLFLGALPPGGAWQAGPPERAPTMLDVDHVHPLTQLVDMSDVVIAQGRALEPPPGGQALFDSTVGTLLAVAPRDGFEETPDLGAAGRDAEPENLRATRRRKDSHSINRDLERIDRQRFRHHVLDDLDTWRGHVAKEHERQMHLLRANHSRGRDA